MSGSYATKGKWNKVLLRNIGPVLLITLSCQLILRSGFQFQKYFSNELFSGLQLVAQQTPIEICPVISTIRYTTCTNRFRHREKEAAEKMGRQLMLSFNSPSCRNTHGKIAFNFRVLQTSVSIYSTFQHDVLSLRKRS